MHRTFRCTQGAMGEERIVQTPEAQKIMETHSEFKKERMKLKSTGLAPTWSRRHQESSTESPRIS